MEVREQQGDSREQIDSETEGKPHKSIHPAARRNLYPVLALTAPSLCALSSLQGVTVCSAPIGLAQYSLSAWEHGVARKRLNGLCFKGASLCSLLLPVCWTYRMQMFTFHSPLHHRLTLHLSLPLLCLDSPHECVKTSLHLLPASVLTQQSSSSVRSHWLAVTSLERSVESGGLNVSLTADATLCLKREVQPFKPAVV